MGGSSRLSRLLVEGVVVDVEEDVDRDEEEEVRVGLGLGVSWLYVCMESLWSDVGGGKWGENVPWSHMEKTDVANAVEAVFERCKGGALREEHKDAVETFVEVGVAFWFEELETQV